MIRIFAPDAFSEGKEFIRTVVFNFLLPLRQMPVRQFIGDAQPVDGMHSEGVIPVPVGKNGHAWKRQVFLFQQCIEFFGMCSGVAGIDRKTPVFSFHISKVGAIPFCFKRHIPYMPG